VRVADPRARSPWDSRCLDELDPPAWGPPPVDATPLVIRCHQLRRKALDALCTDDLRLMIGQRIGLEHLVSVAVDQLDIDPLIDGDLYPGDLLNTVLEAVPQTFWDTHPRLLARLAAALTGLPQDLADDERLAADWSAPLRGRIVKFRGEGGVRRSGRS
jgi:hypothetical protein